MINNDYKSCDFYQNQAKNANSEGIVTFFDKVEAKYYFAFVNVNTEKVIFRSEGYPTAKAQTTGLNSFLKNKTEEPQFSTIKEGGEFFVILKAKNRIEIARSCGFATENEAINAINYTVGKEEVKVVEKAVKATAAPKVAAAKATATKETAKEVKKEAVKATVAPKVAAAKATATKETAKTTTKVAADKAVVTEKTVAKKAVAKKVTTAFANNETYVGHERLTDEFGTTGFALFEGADAKFYFVVYNNDNSVFQRSVGFDSVEQRDATFTSVKSALLNEEAYKVVQENEDFVVAVVAEDGTTLTKSLSYTTFAEAFMNTPRGWTQPTETVGTLY